MVVIGFNLCSLDTFSAQGGITCNGNVISVPSGLSVNWYGVLFILTLPAGTYTMSLNTNVSSGNVGRIQINDTLSGEDLGTLYVDKTIDGARGYFNEKSTFTLTQTTTLYGRYCMDVDYIGNLIGSGGTSVAHSFTIMLNSGSHSYPYEPPYGAIVREKDIEPVLLWENSSPTSDFAAQAITLNQSVANFKYVVIAYKNLKNNTGITYQKYESGTRTCIVASNYMDSSTFVSMSREFAFNGTTTVNVSVCYTQKDTTTSSNDTSYAVPIAIYGTNVL